MLYIDVTTLMHWHRPPVGIVKTLQELVRYALDDETIDYLCYDRHAARYDCITRQSLRRYLDDYRHPLVAYPHPRNRSCTIEKITPLEPLTPPSLQTLARLKHPFEADDILLSIGLDWDYSDYELLYHLKKAIGFHFVGALYDLIPILAPHLVSSEAFSHHFMRHLIALIYLSDKIFTISNRSKEDLRHFASQHDLMLPQVRTIYLGDEVPPAPAHAPRPRPHHPSNYLLYVSTVEARKNHLLLLQTYRSLLDEGFDPPHLLCVGMRGWGVDDLYRLYEEDARLQQLIFFYEDVDDEELAWLYAHAHFTLFPSLAEGWGLATRESLLFGKPVLISQDCALIEATNALMPALPESIDHWAEAIKMLTQEPDILASLHRAIQDHFRPRRWIDFAQELIRFSREF